MCNDRNALCDGCDEDNEGKQREEDTPLFPRFASERRPRNDESTLARTN